MCGHSKLMEHLENCQPMGGLMPIHCGVEVLFEKESPWFNPTFGILDVNFLLMGYFILQWMAICYEVLAALKCIP